MGSPRTRLGSKLGGSISPKPQKGKRYLFLASGVGFPVPAAREAGFSSARPPSSRTGPPRGERERALFSGPSACMLPTMKRPAGIRAGCVRGFGIGAVQRDAGVDTRRACARPYSKLGTGNGKRFPPSGACGFLQRSRSLAAWGKTVRGVWPLSAARPLSGNRGRGRVRAEAAPSPVAPRGGPGGIQNQRFRSIVCIPHCSEGRMRENDSGVYDDCKTV